MSSLVCYAFVNMYMAGIHAGIQAGHAAVELMRHAAGDEQISAWARFDKTLIVKNGGDHSKMNYDWGDRSIGGNDGHIGSALGILGIPYARFNESGLANILTAVAFVLPSDFKSDSFYYNNVLEMNGAEQVSWKTVRDYVIAAHLAK